MIIRLYSYFSVFKTDNLSIESTVNGKNIKDAKKQAILTLMKDQFIPESWRKDPEILAKYITVKRRYGQRTSLFDTEKWSYA
jgi:hypothetical protein